MEFINNKMIFLKKAWYWFKKLPIFPLLCLAPLVIFGISGTMLCIHDPVEMDLSRSLQPPGWMNGGDWSFFLGTDQLGRDLFSRLVQGARASFLVGIFGVIFSGLIGVPIGLIAGFLGGKIDMVIMRIVDTWMAIPGMFFMLMFVFLARMAGITGLAPIVISISVMMWVPYTRMVRSETLNLKDCEYIALAEVTGLNNGKIIIKHILPGVMNTIVVMATTQLGGAIMAEAGMSFLGVGVLPPDIAWGTMIADSGPYMDTAWWIPTFAGAAITLTILGSNLFGDWLRDALDPKTRQSVK